MFSKDVTETDAFSDLSTGAQLLYFHLGMNADDDGFIGSPKRIMKMLGLGDSEMNELVNNNFVFIFYTDSKNEIIVIRDWFQHNSIRSDRYKRTVYTEQKKQLVKTENGSYALATTSGIPSGNQVTTNGTPVVCIGKDSIDKISIDKNNIDKNNIKADAIFNNDDLSEDEKQILESYSDYSDLPF